MNDVTTVLEKLALGKDPLAAEELLSLVYNELRKIAQSKMNHERPGHTLQPTILVNDAWLKLFPEGQNPKFETRLHFFGAAANAMSRILVDHARKRDALKRGKREDISESELMQFAHPAPDEFILIVDEAIKRFAETDEVTSNLIRLRFFVGFTMKEAAKALGISLRSAQRSFKYFSAWFHREYKKDLNI